MTEALTVPTHFTDIASFADGFVDRVIDGDNIVLYGPVAYEEGLSIEFAILLADGDRAIRGTGVVRASIDGGDDRVPETRYDVVLNELDLAERDRVVLDRIVLARNSTSEPPASGDDGAGWQESAESVGEEGVEEFASFMEDDAQQPAASSTGMRSLSDGARGLYRPSIHSTDPPESPPARPAGQSSGKFQYGAVLPIADRPPLPDLALERIAVDADSSENEES